MPQLRRFPFHKAFFWFEHKIQMDDELLIKLISIILCQPSSFAARTGSPIKKISAVDSLKLRLSPSSSIQPPVCYSSDQISKECQQLLQAVQSIFSVDAIIFKTQVDKLVASFRPDLIAKDAVMYRECIFNEFIWEDGLSGGQLVVWKRNEENWAIERIKESLNQNSSYFLVATKSKAFLVNIAGAGRLKPKDSANANNSYVLVTFRGVSWIGPVINGSLNPSFDYSFSVNVPYGESETMIISLWNSPTNPEKNEAFLGCIQLTAADIFRMGESGQDFELPLGKRTKKSHISGHINLKITTFFPSLSDTTKHSMNLTEIYRKGFSSMISNPASNYRALCRACYEWDFLKAASKNKSNLSTVCRSILDLSVNHWRISKTYASLSSLQTAYSLFCQGCVNLEFLYTLFLDSFDRLSSVDGFSTPEVRMFFNLAIAVCRYQPRAYVYFRANIKIYVEGREECDFWYATRPRIGYDFGNNFKSITETSRVR